MQQTSNADILIEYNDSSIKEHAGVIAFVVIVAFLGIIGNASVFMFYGYKVKPTSTSRLIKYLTTNDFIASVMFAINLPVQSTQFVNFESVVYCKMLYFLNHLFVGNSLLLLLLISRDRFLKVCRINSKWNFTLKSTKYWTIAALSFSVVTACGELIVAELKHVNVEYLNRNLTGHICIRSHEGTLSVIFLVVDITLFILITASLIIQYSFILKKLSTVRKKFLHHKIESSRSPENERKCHTDTVVKSVDTPSNCKTQAITTLHEENQSIARLVVSANPNPGNLIPDTTFSLQIASVTFSKPEGSSTEHLIEQEVVTINRMKRACNYAKNCTCLTHTEQQDVTTFAKENLASNTGDKSSGSIVPSADVILTSGQLTTFQRQEIPPKHANSSFRSKMTMTDDTQPCKGLNNTLSEDFELENSIRILPKSNIPEDTNISIESNTSPSNGLSTMETQSDIKHGSQTSVVTSLQTSNMERQVSVMVLVITASSLISFIPYFIYTITEEPNASHRHLESASTRVFAYSFILNSSLNPYIMGIFNREFRQFVRSCDIFTMLLSKSRLCRCKYE